MPILAVGCRWHLSEPGCSQLGPHREAGSCVVAIGSPMPGAPRMIDGAVAAAQAVGVACREAAADLSLLTRLLSGDCDPRDFLMIRPGQIAEMAYDRRIVTAREA